MRRQPWDRHAQTASVLSLDGLWDFAFEGRRRALSARRIRSPGIWQTQFPKLRNAQRRGPLPPADRRCPTIGAGSAIAPRAWRACSTRRPCSSTSEPVACPPRRLDDARGRSHRRARRARRRSRSASTRACPTIATERQFRRNARRQAGLVRNAGRRSGSRLGSRREPAAHRRASRSRLRATCGAASP